MENDTYYLVGKIIESVQNIEHYLIEGTKIAKILNVFTKYKKVSPLYFQKIDEETKKISRGNGKYDFWSINGNCQKI